MINRCRGQCEVLIHMSYSVQQVDIFDYKEVLTSLWERNFQSEFVSRFSWIYEKNSNGIPVVYCLKYEESDSFVGAIALFPRIICINGEKIDAYICGDLVVDSQHRSLGPAIILFKAAIKKCREDAPCILLTFPNEKSGPVVRRVGFKVFGEYCEMTKVTKTYKFILKYMSLPAIAYPLSLVLDWLLFLRYDVFPFLTIKRCTFQVVSEFDERFDDLWDRVAKHFDFIGDRSCRYLRWRIKESPYGEYEIFVLMARKSKKILGYVACSVVDKSVKIIDIAFDEDLVKLSHLFFMFIKYQKGQNINNMTIGIGANNSLINLFKKRGFWMRCTLCKVMIYSASNDANLIKNISEGKWYLTSVDNDI